MSSRRSPALVRRPCLGQAESSNRAYGRTARRALLAGLLPAFWLVLAGIGLVACTSRPTGPIGSDTLEVTVSIVPQQYFVERVGGDRVSVNVMVLPGNNPATYEPRPEQLKVLSSSAAYLAIGVPFEDVWLAKIAAANERMIVVDTAKGIERRPMTESHPEATAGQTEEHGHAAGAPDPHIWVSPALVKVQARNIYEALVQLDPGHEAAYRSNLDSFLGDIDALEADLRRILSGVESKKFIVFHPSWGYFADDFGLEQIAIEVGGQEPSARELARLIQEARSERIRVVFAQPEFSLADAETIAQEIGGEVLLISPLAPDWLDNMQRVARTFAEVLSQ